MKNLILSLGGAALAIIVLAATVAAAGPHGAQAREQVQSRDTISTILGLTQAQVQELRQDGLSLAQIAERQKVDPQKLIDALVEQWTVRVEARVTNGALTAEQATQLKAQLETQARNMVYKTTPGGMQGAAVGAGPNGTASGRGQGAGAGQGWRGGNGTGQGARGAAAGTGTCDGTGPHGAGQP